MPEPSSTQRPGRYGACTSYIRPGYHIDITSFDSTGASSIIENTASAGGQMVYAMAFDGGVVSSGPISSTSVSSRSTQGSTPPLPVSSTPTQDSSSTQLPGTTSVPSSSTRYSTSSTSLMIISTTLSAIISGLLLNRL